RLLMEESYGKVEMWRRGWREEVEEGRGEVEIEEGRGVMNMRRTGSKLTIDEREGFADMDIKWIFRG
uniref:DUF6470 family protein n=1 Tax=Bacillus altitudinis TaxID=293387 RepID=UPI00307F7DB5